MWLTLRSYSPDEHNTKVIYVVNHGWHTGIIVELTDIPLSLLPEKQHFKGARYLEIGWGDAGFYQSRQISTSLALKALFTQTQSVMHLASFRDSVHHYFQASKIITLRLKQTELDFLIKNISDTFVRKGGIATPLMQGRYGKSFFYPAAPKYHLFRTCNNWTAQMLQYANIPVKNWLSGSATGLIWQLNAMQ